MLAVVTTAERCPGHRNARVSSKSFQMDGLVMQWAAVLVDQHGDRTDWLFPKVSMSGLSSHVGLGILRWKLVGSR